MCILVGLHSNRKDQCALSDCSSNFEELRSRFLKKTQYEGQLGAAASVHPPGRNILTMATNGRHAAHVNNPLVP
jgi:hypothetical protein